jgi:hypothetical protein
VKYGKVKSPIHINIINDDPYRQLNFQLFIKPGTRVYACDHYLIVGSLKIEISKPKIYIPRTKHYLMPIEVNDWVRDHLLADIIKKYFFIVQILEKTPKNELMHTYALAYDAMKKFWLNEISAENLKNLVIKYIGLGDGFTPSYDDFISTALGITNLLIINKGRGRPIFINRDLLERKTTWVSARLSEYTINGDFTEIVDGIMYSILNNDTKLIWNPLLTSLSIGHTSGVDAVLGLFSAITAYLMSEGASYVDDILKSIFNT